MAATTRDFEIFSRIQPHEYLRRFIDQSVRPDGRTLDRFRNTLITSGAIATADGSAMVRLGGTTVVCGIKAEVCEPSVEHPNQGYLVPNVELSPLCSPKFKPGPPSEKAQAVSEFIHQLFTQSQVFPLETLCIEPGKAVWVLYADIVCLNYDGNIIDASVTALVTALRNMTLPKAHVSESMVVEADVADKYQPIPFARIPVSSTFCVFHDPTVLLADPNDTEETLTQETVTIIMDTEGEVYRVYKNGGTSVTPQMLSKCFALARKRTQEIASLICHDQ